MQERLTEWGRGEVCLAEPANSRPDHAGDAERGRG